MCGRPIKQVYINTYLGSARSEVELLNIQSLLPKQPDVQADLDRRHTDRLRFTESNLGPSTPGSLVTVDAYCLLRRDRVLGRKKASKIAPV